MKQDLGGVIHTLAVLLAQLFVLLFGGAWLVGSFGLLGLLPVLAGVLGWMAWRAMRQQPEPQAIARNDKAR